MLKNKLIKYTQSDAHAYYIPLEGFSYFIALENGGEYHVKIRSTHLNHVLYIIPGGGSAQFQQAQNEIEHITKMMFSNDASEVGVIDLDAIIAEVRGV